MNKLFFFPAVCDKRGERRRAVFRFFFFTYVIAFLFSLPLSSNLFAVYFISSHIAVLFLSLRNTAASFQKECGKFLGREHAVVNTAPSVVELEKRATNFSQRPARRHEVKHARKKESCERPLRGL